MKKTNLRSLFVILTLLVVTGTLAAFIGIYGTGDGRQTMGYFQSLQIAQTDNTLDEEALASLHSGVAGYFTLAQTNQQASPAAQQGVSVGELMRWAGVLAVFAAITILIFIEFVYRNKINRLNYRVLLIVSLFVLPVIVGLGTSVTVLETTKTVESCASCHVMGSFVNDLYDPHSSSLAARHYKNGWISESQCYTCHTTYGAHGTFEGKRDGFRHWLLYVTNTWPDPIAFAGSYPNINCTSCHGGSSAFREVPSHQALTSKLLSDEVSCTSCHGPAHPTPGERDDVPERQLQPGLQSVLPAANEIETAEIEKLMGF